MQGESEWGDGVGAVSHFTDHVVSLLFAAPILCSESGSMRPVVSIAFVVYWRNDPS